MGTRAEKLRPYQWTVVVIGGLVTTLCINQLHPARLDLRFLLLAFVTLGVSSRIYVRIPRHEVNITLADTFIFLAILIYGGAAAVLLATAEGISSGLRISKQKKPITILFNAAVLACSTACAVCALWLVSIVAPNLHSQGYSGLLVAAVTMGLAQYIANSILIAVGLALKSDQPIHQTWSKHCGWLSISTFIGAASAGAISNFIDSAGFYAFLVSLPVICIVYITYNKYLEDIRATSAQAEQSERARAEAERERAEAAERHVEEQNRHIAELERISRELQESREHFRHAAFHDSLTGLPNRTLLTDQLKFAIERSRRRQDHLFAVLFLDLDRFKNINDSLGHAAGDQLLIKIAQRLEKCLRPTDMVARLGGDEFAILLDGLESQTDAIRVADRVQEELMCSFILNGHEVYAAASIGITLNNHSYDDPENVLRDADTAMYRAKEKGKGRYELFDTDMHADAMARLRLENDLRHAIEHREFEVYYQPIMTLSTRKIAGFEALIRWHHPERGFVSPTEFIPLAEETRLITEIGDWVLFEACRQMNEWRKLSSSHCPLTISVNLSSKQFTQHNLIERIKETLLTTGLPPQCLKLEITESAVMDNADDAAAMLDQLREMGIQLSIDDFGTGYSSLSYLHRFPVNTLKVDRSFVSRMGEGDENAEIVRTIVTLASNLGMAVIAEGVETEGQHEQLKDLKCDYGQGYLYSRPVTAGAAAELLRESLQTDYAPVLTLSGTDRRRSLHAANLAA